MANETIEDIVRDVRHVSELHGMSYKDDKNWHLTIHNYTRILADRIEAAHKAETEENTRLKAANAKMREALLLIAGGKDARGNYEEVAWHMAQFAKAALEAEGGTK